MITHIHATCNEHGDRCVDPATVVLLLDPILDDNVAEIGCLGHQFDVHIEPVLVAALLETICLVCLKE